MWCTIQIDSLSTLAFCIFLMLQSCPAIRVFSAENLERGLDSATKSFCTQEVCIDKDGVGTLYYLISFCLMALIITILVVSFYKYTHKII